MLSSTDAFQRLAGITACALHRVDPGPALVAAIDDADAPLRARALRCAGEIGRRDLLEACKAHLKDEDAACRFNAARSAVWLGDRGEALAVLAGIAREPGPHRLHALATTLFAADAASGRALIDAIAKQRDDARLLVRACAYAGDPQHVPWLIKLMADDKFARLAGEAFSFITGADLAALDLERKPPENIEGGPNDDPEDDNVAMDEDDGLPWPDQARVQAWWNANALRFAAGRYFMGAAPEWSHCTDVLKRGYQRQRMAAAQYLCLIKPGTVLFNCKAPAWRQQRLLDKLA